jgi:hypothetical protein
MLVHRYESSPNASLNSRRRVREAGENVGGGGLNCQTDTPLEDLPGLCHKVRRFPYPLTKFIHPVGDLPRWLEERAERGDLGVERLAQLGQRVVRLLLGLRYRSKHRHGLLVQGYDVCDVFGVEPNSQGLRDDWLTRRYGNYGPPVSTCKTPQEHPP